MSPAGTGGDPPAGGEPGAGRVEEDVQARLRDRRLSLPVVTVTWAQSVTGAIAGAGGAPVAISGPASMAMTHRLRSFHDAILVGIGTVLADDPLLSVRLAPGRQPQPVILDSHLRFPLTARMLARADRKPWIFHSGGGAAAAAALEERGAVLFVVGRGSGGLDLRHVLRVLSAAGVSSLMVEGGAQVLRAFMGQRLAAQLVVTESPAAIDGVPGPAIPRLASPFSETLGADRVTWGRLDPEAAPLPLA